MSSITFARRRAPAALALLLTGGLVAACGSSSSNSTTTHAPAGAVASANGGTRNRTAFRQCLQQHGITLPARPPGGRSGGPRPGSGSGGPPRGGGVFGGGGAGGGFRSNPKLRAAVQACGGGNFRRGRRLQISHTAITNYVACVRKHGFNMPSPNFSGKGPVFPASIRTNPKFEAASKSCQSLLFRGRPTTGARA